jgi:hypothetical protein
MSAGRKFQCIFLSIRPNDGEFQLGFIDSFSGGDLLAALAAPYSHQGNVSLGHCRLAQTERILLGMINDHARIRVATKCQLGRSIVRTTGRWP